MDYSFNYTYLSNQQFTIPFRDKILAFLESKEHFSKADNKVTKDSTNRVANKNKVGAVDRAVALFKSFLLIFLSPFLVLF